MFTTFFQGFLLSAAMILPIGAQNAFVLQQGSKKTISFNECIFMRFK